MQIMLLSQPIEEKRHMTKASASKANRTAERPAPGQAGVVDSTKLKRTRVWGETDKAVSWKGAFAVYGGEGGTTASSTIVYDEVEPGKRLGWHTDATEGNPVHHRRAGQALSRGRIDPSGRARQRVRAADADAPRPGEYRQGDLARCGFLRRGHVHADFDQVMPPKSHILGTPNRAG
jgi:hypothetical protein